MSTMETKENDLKQIRRGIVVILILLLLLVFSSVVLARTISDEVPGNTFSFGSIQIGIGYHTQDGDGNPVDVVDTDSGILPLFDNTTANGEEFAKGSSMSRKFFVYNKSSVNNEYFSIYIDNIPPEAEELANILTVQIFEIENGERGNKLFPEKGKGEVKVKDFTVENVPYLGELIPKNGDDVILKELEMVITYPSSDTNPDLNGTFTFDICTKGTQVKNNPKS